MGQHDNDIDNRNPKSLQTAFQVFTAVSNGRQQISGDEVKQALALTGINIADIDLRHQSAISQPTSFYNFEQFYTIIATDNYPVLPNKSHLIDFLSGSFAGVAVTVVGHPFDTVKVRLQTQQDARFRNGLHCLTKTLKTEGVLALYKGMAGPLMSLPLLNAVVFGSYGIAKSAFEKSEEHLSVAEITIAGSFAGLINSVIVGPLELIKTKMQIQYGFRNLLYSSPIHCTRELLRIEGLNGMFRGMSSTVIREILGYGGQFAVYELVKRGLTSKEGSMGDLSAAKLMLAGGISGIAAWAVSYPADYIKSQLQAIPIGQASPYKKHPWIPDGGGIDCYRQIVSKNGHKAVWAGFGPCIARAFPANAAGFLAYELASNFLSRHVH